MVFSSLFFVYVFLPLNLFFYYRARNIQGKNIVMLIFSLIFYSWNGPKYLFLILFMAFVSWISALMIEVYPSKKKTYLIADVAISLGTLGYFKYLGFFATVANELIGSIPIPQVVLPIGISFYTFQLLSYVIDVYRQEVQAQKSYMMLLLYVSMFHQCIAGPIVRYSDVQHDILHRQKNYEEIKQGVRRFCYGLAKKAIIANGIAQVADTFLLTSDKVALSEVSMFGVLLGAVSFTFQIYFDFSAYSDMAIGMGLMTGFHYKENFNLPYTSDSVSEFWRRWHISLGTFFRDYVYISLGGNRRGNVFFNLFVVWFLTGMWHGASFNYILWGLYFFVFIVLEKIFLQKALNKLPKFVGVCYTLMVVIFGWILFKFENLETLTIAIKGLFGLNGNPVILAHDILVFKNYVFLIFLAAIASSNLPKKVYIHFAKSKNFLVREYILPLYNTFFPWILLMISSLALIGNSYNPFLYFQF